MTSNFKHMATFNNIGNYLDQSNLLEPERDTIIVAIPYLAAGAQGPELVNAVSGWIKHFKEKFRLVIVGDWTPLAGKTPGIDFLECRRVEGVPGEYLPALDIINKMLYLHEHYQNSNGCIWAADDIYAVNDFDFADVRFLKMLQTSMKFSPDDGNPWKRMMARTAKILSEEGLPTHNYAVHLPCWYEWDKLEYIIDKYDLRHRSLSVQSLYFNNWFAGRVPFRLNNETDNIKYGVYSHYPSVDEMRNAFQTKIWINNSVVGYNDLLMGKLAAHYVSSSALDLENTEYDFGHDIKHREED